MVTRFPTLTRRDFLRVGGVGVAGYSLLPMLQATNLQSPAAVTPRGGAEICIFIMLQFGPSKLEHIHLSKHKFELRVQKT